ncbi:MAG: hypothetical protein AMS27_11465 [Bacteroides sp. SM23_62_1]|nr:MAG: hypothetical protein AMS27_11465 [Bacteroides sp. SM23_62_1]
MLDKSEISYDEEMIQHEANKLVWEDKQKLSEKRMNSEFYEDYLTKNFTFGFLFINFTTFT